MVKLHMIDNRRIAVLGGGNAGWLTALFCKQIFPKSHIIVIDNENIGPVGVGEATTPHFVDFLKDLNIDLRELVKETSATIKNGISFENWNGDSKRYFHGFHENNDLNKFSIDPYFGDDCIDFYYKSLILKNLDLNEYTYPAKLSYEKKVDLHNLNFALHFDAGKMGQYLKKVGTARGIGYANDNFKKVTCDSDHYLNSIVCEKNKYAVDFVFDTTGFHRLLIKNHFKVKWNSLQETLPMKKALAFNLDKQEPIDPYTTATALPHGGVWNIPLQDRIGAGYVFDSNYINEDQALEEVEKFLNKKITVRKVIDFEPGYFDKFWINNCMSVGLSSSFVEPLESTSLFLTVTQLKLIPFFVNHMFTKNNSGYERFNSMMVNSMKDIVNFIYLHYCTKRQDSLFWKEFKDKTKPPDTFNKFFTKIKNMDINWMDFPIHEKAIAYFELYNFLQVSAGLNHFEKFNLKGYEDLTPDPEKYKQLVDFFVSQGNVHKEIL